MTQTLAEQILMFGIAYLIGSVPFGLLVSRWMGVDVRNVGSGNIGATNVLRATGRLGGLLTLLGDSLKGLLPVLLAQALWPGSIGSYAIAVSPILGHNYPIYLRFSGGKGVATSFGVLFGLWPWVGGLTLVTWALVAKLTRYSSLGALIAFALLPFFVFLHVGTSPQALILAGLITVLIFVRHRENIKCLRLGKERRIGEKA